MTRFLLVLALFVFAFPVFAQDDMDMQPMTLRFAATVGDEAATCDATYTAVGADDAEISFTDFRFYVSNVHLLTPDGDTVPVTLHTDGVWQNASVALLDFENGEAGCADIGNAALNGEVMGMVPPGDYVGVRFDMGVPFETNHLDVTTADSPLNIAAMWWNWQGGYKFIRVDVLTDAEENNAWNIHLGSTGCESASGVVPPAEPCARPNVPTITLNDFDFENDVIVADLAGLLDGVPLYENTLMPPGCQSGVDDPDCPGLFPNFGLSLEDGGCIDGNCDVQTFFRVATTDSVTLVERTAQPMQMDMDMDMDMSDHEHDHDGS